MGIIYGIDKLPKRNEKYELIQNDIVENTDVCIIGSGAAGAVLAKELAEVGKSVILLERGGYYEGKDMNQRETDGEVARVSLSNSASFLWENIADFQRKHRGAYIAIHNGKLIAVEESFSIACEAIKSQNIELEEVLLWHIPVARIA